MQTSNKNIEHEINLKELIKIFFNYKILIVITMILFLILSAIYLFFKPSIYSTHAIIEVNTFDKNSRVTDDLLQNAFYSTNVEIEKEMEILKTFEINKLVINQMDLSAQFFKREKYNKKHELFDKEIPIKFKKIKILNKKIVGKRIKLIPNAQGFRLELKSDKILVQDKTTIINIQKDCLYNKKIKTPYFELQVQKRFDYNGTIEFILNGDSRSIYENIVSKNLIIQQINKNAPLIKISYEDTIPERATTYVNKLVEVFLKEGLKIKNKRNNKILTFINNNLKKQEKVLAISEENLKKYKVKNNIINSTTQVDTIIQKLSNLEVEISKNRLKTKLVHKMIRQFHETNSIDSIGPFLIELNDSGSMKLLTLLQDLRLQAKVLSEEYTNEYPKLMAINNQIVILEKKIISNIQNLKISIQENENNLEKLQKRYEKRLLKFPVKEMELINLTRENEVNSKMYHYLLKKKSENDMIKAAIISDFKVVERAYSSDKPIKPKKSLVMVFSLILGLLIGMLLALVHHNTSNKINKTKDIEEITSLEVNTNIPHIKNTKRREIEVFKHPQSDFANSFRKLRTDLSFSRNEDVSQVVSINSMTSKEGKSMVAVNLAAVFQLAGYRTLLIDMAFKNPVLHQYFDISYENRGISNYLNEDIDLNEIIVSTEYPNLDLIPIGSNFYTLSEFITSRRMRELLEKLKREYDYIFIDNTDVYTLIDTVSIMHYSDINFIVMRAGRSKKSIINKVEKMVKKYSLKNIGLILNDLSKSNQKDETFI